MFHQYYKWIRCFHAVARTGGFTAAAQYLHIGQPTVTDQVKALEERFGVELFYRTGRTVLLTDSGEQLYGITRGLFGLEDEAMQFLHSVHKLKAGLVRVGGVSPPIALDLARRFRGRHASLELSVSIGSEVSVLRGLQDFDIDVGILAEPDPVEGLHIMPFRRERIVAVVPDNHRLAGRASLTMRDIADEGVILREAGSKTRNHVENAAAQNGVTLLCVMEINSREAILHAVASGIGISFVTEIECIPLPGIRIIPVDEPLLGIGYSLCCLEVRKKRPLIAAVFDMAG
ncbi:MAG: LysR family transcriptional regulator [Cupriavidus sp.]|jgi:aminoethylphosphonate catabolism LysR family transcriptional regulator|uniref:LysR substrate-binding domain-containing protein n=1 Tax=Cupriavidus pauculus TaxID=82633 RepID=UPI000786000D|nr:LysR substrate-binding domain-containing protein [Cupriavidus pauculus]MBU68580.1 LysR family transcriptional regulator [Cupriavidus sp.]MBY4731022.1 LysR family transcriptional regulator [Cupriavidus pauculus]MCM3607351.1 LysR substrate-binding domain-containing protein [Cupriavidus pauculus]